MKAGAINPLAAAPEQTAEARQAAQTKQAAKQLEAFFLRRLLAETRPQGAGMLDGGFAGDTFKEMLDEAIADKMAGAGGIGMATMFAKQLGGGSEIPAAGTTSLAPGLAPGLATGGLPGRFAMPGPELGPSIDGSPHLLMPVAGRPTSGYGLRSDPVHGTATNHPGFDLAAPTGTPVAAAAGGTVTHAGPAGTYGNLVTVRHGDGFETRYAHLSAIGVAVGDKVEAGQQVGAVGSTGYSTGPHLHFEVRHDGQATDPAPFLPLNRSGFRTNR